jgi:hypothetical protein
MHAAKEKQQAMTVKRISTSGISNADKQSQPKSAEPALPRAAFTIKEFCEAHRLSEAMYFKLRAAGFGPREMRTGRKVTISMEAAKEWRRARENSSQAVPERAA